jgi:DNA-binding NarL/FixJ family response regulator
MALKVFICDDAPGLRALLRAYLEQEADVAVVGEADDGHGLAGRVRDADPDVVLLDLMMPRVGGLEALAELRAAGGRPGVVVLSGSDDLEMATRALALGADRYVEKAAGMEQVRVAVRAVATSRRSARSPRA